MTERTRTAGTIGTTAVGDLGPCPRKRNLRGHVAVGCATVAAAALGIAAASVFTGCKRETADDPSLTPPAQSAPAQPAVAAGSAPQATALAAPIVPPPSPTGAVVPAGHSAGHVKPGTSGAAASAAAQPAAATTPGATAATTAAAPAAGSAALAGNPVAAIPAGASSAIAAAGAALAAAGIAVPSGAPALTVPPATTAAPTVTAPAASGSAKKPGLFAPGFQGGKAADTAGGKADSTGAPQSHRRSTAAPSRPGAQ